MKKACLLLSISVAALSCSLGALASGRVGLPHFQDNFTVTVGQGMPAQIQYLGQDGDIYNYGDVYCSGPKCFYTVTDHGDFTSTGHVKYLVGDQSKRGPYCIVSIEDGSLYPAATMSTQCANGASPTVLLHNDHDYQFSINLN